MTRWLLAAALCAGCGGASPGTAAEVSPPSGDRAVAEPSPPAPALRGLPHRRPINRVELSADGRVAVSRDQLGRLRWWPALDGSREPLPILAPEAREIALGRAGGGHDIAVIDTAGGVHLFHASAPGAIDKRWELPAETNALDVQVLDGGGLAVLRGDRVIEVRDRGGERLAEYERRQFRPDRIRVAGPGALLAIEIAASATSASLTFHRLTLERSGGRASLRAEGAGFPVEAGSFAPGRQQSAVSPDGAMFAFLRFDQPSASWKIVTVDLLARSHRELGLEGVTTAQTPALGFVGRRQLLLRGGNNSASWLVDIDGGSVVTVPVRGAVDTMGATAFAPALVVSGMGAWLQVYRVKDREPLYLGYEAFSPAAAAYSPAAELAAWASGDELYLESSAGIARRQVSGDQSIRAIFFVDARRLITVYQSGAIELHDWKANRSLGVLDGGGGYVDSGYDARRRLVYAMPHHGQVWVAEVGAGGLSGPYVVADGSTRAGVGGGRDALWTLDARGLLATYSLAEIRGGAVLEAARDRAGGSLPMAVSVDRTAYSVAYRDGTVNLVAFPIPRGSGDSPPPVVEYRAEAPLPAAPSIVAVSPDGARVAAVANNVLFAFTADALEELWSFPLAAGVSRVSWSADSSHLAVATPGGAAVLSAASGHPVIASCGPRFVARRSQPPALHAVSPQQSLCEE